jgi:putative tributyrin esterase
MNMIRGKRHAINARTALCWWALLSLAYSASAQTASREGVSATARGHKELVRDQVFHSASLQRDMHYRVLLPEQYFGSTHRFAVLYLLHGLYGDYLNWDTRTRLEDYVRGMALLIVMPDAGNSWYSNSATIPQDKFEDYVARDLISEIESRYHTIRDRRGRFIAGLSMGGYGAVKLALQYPELFAFAGSLSGAMNAPENLDSLRQDFRAKLREVFGEEGSSQRRENDISLLLSAPRQIATPYFYLACGAQDFFLDANRTLVLQLSSRKVAYEYHETPGGHTWEYWDGALRPMLEALGRVIVAGRSPRSIAAASFSRHLAALDVNSEYLPNR